MVSTTDLVSYWKLEGDGTRTDSVGSNDLTETGTVAEVAGKNGNAAEFDLDTSNFLSIDDGDQSGLDPASDFSLGCWINLDTVATQQHLMTKYGGSDPRWELFVQADATVRFTVRGDSAVNAVSTNTLSQDTTYLVVATYDADGEMKVYVNGELWASATSPGGSLGNGWKFCIGVGFQGAIYPVDGWIDEAFFFSRALSQTDVSELFNATIGTSGDDADGNFYDSDNSGDFDGHKIRAGLNSYYKLEEASGSRVDAVGNNDMSDNGSTGNTSAKHNNGVNPAGTNKTEYLSNTSFTNPPSEDITIAFWANFDTHADDEGVWAQGGSGVEGDEPQIFLEDQGGSDLKLRFNKRTSPTDTVRSAVVSDTETHFFVFTRKNGGNLSVYTDGTLGETDSATSGLNTSGEVHLCRSPVLLPTPNTMDGWLDEFAIFNRELSADEVTALHQSGSGNFYDNDNADDFDFEVAAAVYPQLLTMGTL